MNKILTNMKKSNGYVSIEGVIVSGLVFGIGTFLVIRFGAEGQALTVQGTTNVESVDFDGMANFKSREF